MAATCNKKLRHYHGTSVHPVSKHLGTEENTCWTSGEKCRSILVLWRILSCSTVLGLLSHVFHLHCFYWVKVVNCRPVQHPDSSNMKPCCCNKCIKHYLAEICKAIPEKDIAWIGNLYLPFSIDGASSDVQAASSIGTDAPQYLQRLSRLKCS